LSDRSGPVGRARTVLHDFEARSGTMQREIGQNELASFGASQKWTALPTGAADQPQVRQAPRQYSLLPLSTSRTCWIRKGSKWSWLLPPSVPTSEIDVVACGWMRRVALFRGRISSHSASSTPGRCRCSPRWPPSVGPGLPGRSSPPSCRLAIQRCTSLPYPSQDYHHHRPLSRYRVRKR